MNKWRLGQIYQLQENTITLSILLPYLACHFATEGMYFVIGGIGRSHYSSQYDIEYLQFVEGSYTVRKRQTGDRD
jgi:hypothetical protein